MSENLSYLSGRKGIDTNLFDKMVHLASEGGTPEDSEKKKLAKEFLMGDAIIHGTTSFYDFLKAENKGKKAYVCNGSVCMMAGTQENLKNTLEKTLGKDAVGEMCCLGRCHENSAFNYNKKNYSAQSSAEISSLLTEHTQPVEKKCHVESDYAPAILTAPPTDIDLYYQTWQKVLSMQPNAIIEEIKTSGLRGRGGAGFPMGFKCSACADENSLEKYVVCNADEGDPGAFTDGYLLEQQPHLVLLGMMISGYSIGADTGVLYIRAEYPESIEIINDAVEVLKEKKLIGNNIFDSGFNFKFKIIRAAGAYICGEETALLSSIEGQRPEVRVRPPYPTKEGLFNKPTLLNNVETFANLSKIIVDGGKAYSNIGTEKSTGTKLLSLDRLFNRPGVYEVEMGTSLLDVIKKLGKGFREPVKGLHIGGPLGGIVPKVKFKDLSIDYESFASQGFLLGHGSLVGIPESYPMIKYLEHLFKFTADESCGKCFPCRLGATRGHEMLEKAIGSDYKIDPNLFDDLLETMEIGSLCALGGGLPLGIKNALEFFPKELQEYFESQGVS